MSGRLSVALALFAVLMLGFVRIWIAILRHVREREEVGKFTEVFGKYMHSGGDDLEAYGYLIERSNRVQELLGPIGVMAQFVAPFRAFTVDNYQIILNALPAMRRDLERGSSRRSDYAPIIGETLIRYRGVSEDLITAKQRLLKNPIVWFREGVAAVLLWPVQLLQSLGLASESRTASVATSALFRMITGVVTLVGLVGSIITIVLGWKQTLGVLRRVIGW